MFPPPRVVLLRLDRDPAHSRLARLHERLQREQIDVDVLVLNTHPEILERLLAEHRPLLFVLCHTPSMTTELRLRVKRRFMAHAKVGHRLTTIFTEHGLECCRLDVVADYCDLAAWGESARETIIARMRGARRRPSGLRSTSAWLRPVAGRSLRSTEYRYVRLALSGPAAAEQAIHLPRHHSLETSGRRPRGRSVIVDVREGAADPAVTSRSAG